MEQTTIADIFTLSIDAEKEAREFYTHFARAFSAHDDARNFFTEMADDEASHIENIQSMHEAITPEKMNSPASPVA